MLTRFDTPAAVACIHGDGEHSSICGKVSFFSQGNGTLVAADICGLPDSETGFFAMHIHEGTDCCGQGFPNTRSHYDPDAKPHPRHAGDLPPLLSCDGKAWLAVLSNRFCLREIIGKTVVIHAQPDDFRTQPSGGAGSKIACGVICRV